MVLDLLALVFAILVFSLAYSHALEWPGKLRLSQHDYLIVQQIFFPGFTIAGMLTELPALGLVLAAVIVKGSDGGRLLALLGLALVNLLFWSVVQPVNRRWIRSGSLQKGAENVEVRTDGQGGDRERAWRSSRLQWELGHAGRAASAALAVGGLISSVAAH